jgi:predicted nucleotidyltransferase
MKKEKVLSYLKQNKEKFRDLYGVSDMALFGSYARDEASEDSDIDILVEMPSKMSSFFALKRAIEKDLGKSVDIGFFDTLRLFIKNKIKNEIIYV